MTVELMLKLFLFFSFLKHWLVLNWIIIAFSQFSKVKWAELAICHFIYQWLHLFLVEFVKALQEKYLSLGNLELISMFRTHLISALRSSGYVSTRGPSTIQNLNVHSESWSAVKAALTAGRYPNMGRYSPITERVIVANDNHECHFNFTSSLLTEIKVDTDFAADNTNHDIPTKVLLIYN